MRVLASGGYRRTSSLAVTMAENRVGTLRRAFLASWALLTDSARRGFAISFFTSRRIVSLNALLLFLRGMMPSSCHAPKAENGQFRPEEEILEMHSCQSDGRPCAGKSAQQPRRSYSCRKMLRREL